MNEELENLERMLERTTAAEDMPQDDLDGEAARLREGWIAFGRLLEAAQPAETSLRRLPLPRRRPQRRLWSAAGLLAASLVVCGVAMWMLQAPGRTKNASPAAVQTAATGVRQSAPPTKTNKQATTSTGLKWDDSFDEQVAQLSQNVIDAEQGSSVWADTGAVQSKIEQIQQEFKDNSL